MPESLGHTHHINLADYSAPRTTQTAVESDAVEIFRGIPVVEIKSVFTPLLASLKTLTEHTQTRIAEGFLISGGDTEQLLINDDHAQVHARFSDVGRLLQTLTLLDGNRIVAGLPSPFQQLVGEQVSSDELIEHSVGLSVSRGTLEPLLLSVVAAFTPADERDRLLHPSRWSLRRHEFEQIVANTPDLTKQTTPQERLDAVIAMLIPPSRQDMKALHTQALDDICKQEGITSLDDLNTSDPVRFREIHKKAGERLFSGNLFAVFTDTTTSAGSSRRFGSVFRVHPDGHGGPEKTERKMCVAADFVGHYQHAVGELLQENKHVILQFIQAE